MSSDGPISAAADPSGAGKAQVSLPTLIAVFAKIGLMSFGGALSGWMYREIVQRRHWLAEDEFLSGLALGQIMPGANVANLSLFIGQRLRGGSGAIAALGGMLLPPMVLVVVLAALYLRLGDVVWLHRLVGGVAASAIGLTAMVGIRATRRVERRRAPLAVLLVIFIAVGVLRWPMVPVVLCLTPVSLAFAYLALKQRHA
ncbi:MAG TPA: chromate transporter [Stellaceae bacterium]|nr:chromate transporter [Stellaceae bacterium]